MLSDSETAAVHALRVRHGLACVRATTLSTGPNPDALAQAVSGLTEVGKRLSDDQIDDCLPVLELVEQVLALAEQHLRAAEAAAARRRPRRWPTPFGSA